MSAPKVLHSASTLQALSLFSAGDPVCRSGPQIFGLGQLQGICLGLIRAFGHRIRLWLSALLELSQAYRQTGNPFRRGAIRDLGASSWHVQEDFWCTTCVKNNACERAQTNLLQLMSVLRPSIWLKDTATKARDLSKTQLQDGSP